MNQIEALQRLRALAAPVVETRDVAALLKVSTRNATTILRRLAMNGMIIHLSRGRWLVSEKIDPLALPEPLSAPHPAYVSLQSALFHHGLIEQIPAAIYAVTLGRPCRLQTPMGAISFHQMPPDLFKGFEVAAQSDAKIATAGKALFDLFYLGPGRARIFSSHPEIAIPVRFRWAHLMEYTKLVKSSGRRAYVTARIRAVRSAS